MIHNEFTIPKANSRIVLMGDLHIGAVGYREDIFDAILDEIRKPNTYWIGIGDYIEGREPGHKFYDMDTPMTVGEQYRYFLDRIEDVADRCTGMHLGNHECSLVDKTGVSPVEDFCYRHKIMYLGDISVTQLKTPYKNYRMLSLHGSGGGIKMGAQVNKFLDYVKHFNGLDLAVIGHYHKLAQIVSLTNKDRSSGQVGWYPCNVIFNGSALAAYESGMKHSYAERGMMPPNALGFAIIELREKGMAVELRPY